MKPSAIIIALAPLGHALVGLSGAMSGKPSGGLKDLTFGIKANNVQHASGYYFAQQFYFQDRTACGYTGLQPRADSKGKTVVHGAFSSFIANTTTDHPNCGYGADGGPGVSCSVNTPGSYESEYNFVIKNVGGTKWSGTMVEVNTGKATEIGTWTLPSDTGGLKSTTSGFIEYYKGIKDCSELQYADVTFYNPTSETPGAGNGTIYGPYEYGPCVGKVDFSKSKVTEAGGGYEIKVGFPAGEKAVSANTTTAQVSRAAVQPTTLVTSASQPPSPADSAVPSQVSDLASHPAGSATSGGPKPTGKHGRFHSKPATPCRND